MPEPAETGVTDPSDQGKRAWGRWPGGDTTPRLVVRGAWLAVAGLAALIGDAQRLA